jgi:putative protease
MDKKSTKPELLLPAGNTEAFYAAVEGGADAVYFGLKQFNARERADNFGYPELLSLLEVARKHNIKTYLTLNTLIKNRELPDLLDTLYAVSQTGLSAIIIQDWGVYNLVKSHFKELAIHGSTQMANHNSAGAIFSHKKGFERIIMARELTRKELTQISQQSNIELELFVHGALCYSFSGMCLFSSYLGGMSANRGMCMQPCRRLYSTNKSKKYIFSLKDNQLIDYVPQLKKMGIRSLKVEGRLKPAEYVYRVARAYRMALDSPEKLDEAREILNYDLGREKTAYFFGGQVEQAITQNPSTGKFAGKVVEKSNDAVWLQSKIKLEKGNRLWIRSPEGKSRKAIKIKEIQTEQGKTKILGAYPEIKKNDLIYLANFRQKKFQNKFEPSGKSIKEKMPDDQKKKILHNLSKPKKLGQTQLFLRIDSIKWLKKVPFREIDNLIINLSVKEWEELDLSAFILKKNARKIFFELPGFIPEGRIPFYKNLLRQMHQKGFTNFMLSHLSQKQLIPDNSTIAVNENVYVLNDAAVNLLAKEGIRLFTYPLENNRDNLMDMNNRKGIVPVYFFPKLFYSRMPVRVNDENNHLKDDKGYSFRKHTRNGMTIITPEQPVSLFQYKKELTNKGFGRFLIDVSHEKPSGNRISTLIKNFRQSSQIQPSTNFNFKKGLT